MADVFISYKSERRPAVEHLARVLENYGFTVWFDYALLSGKQFAPQIEREIRAARAVLVLWCNRSVESEWVKDEARIAKERETLIPISIEETSLTPLICRNGIAIRAPELRLIASLIRLRLRLTVSLSQITGP
jgi:hypothetical protein